MQPVLIPDRTLNACFSDSYQEAQEKFRRQFLGEHDHSRYAEFVYKESGPADEKLVTAVAWLGDPEASRVLVLQSATHGVEGFAGSAIQLDCLASLAEDDLPAGVSILLIHAVNPYGFAWLRRVNEHGVDLNRNLVDFDRPLPENPGYAELADDLVPADDAQWEAATQRLAVQRERLGQRAFEQAVTGGQYQFAAGLFYGGTTASQSRLNLQRIINEHHLAERERVAVIDVHTGLGPFGYGEVICDHAPGSQGVSWARQWYGDSVTEPALGSSSSVPKTGLIDYLWHARLAQRGCFVTLEFGTYPMDRLLEVLRRDHMLHRQPVDWSDARTQALKSALKHNFYPASGDWREMILLRGRQLIRQALNGLRGN